jgi:hypothetical protein
VNHDGQPLRRGEALILIGFLGIGLAWSWWGRIYDLMSPGGRVALTLLSIAASFLLMWAGLVAARVPRQGRAEAAIWAIVPWNGVLLSQLAYVGYMFIPLEILASTLLLRRRTPLSRGRALVLATLIRGGVFVIITGAASVARRLLPR